MTTKSNILKIARKHQGHSLKDLEKATGIHSNALRHFETQEISAIPHDRLMTISKVLNYEQYVDHTIDKRHTAKNPFDFFTTKPLHVEKDLSFIAWLKIGLVRNTHTLINTPPLRKIVMFMIIVFGLAFMSDLIVVETLAGSAIVPVTLLIFVFCSTEEKTINLGTLVKLFVYGGISSIFVVYFFRDLVGYPGGLSGDMLTGFIEEGAKIAVVYWLLRRYKVQTMRAGILVGFAVGAGFDVFETTDYAIMSFMETGNYRDFYFTMGLRSIFSLFGIGHHFWTGILAGALVYLKKHDRPFLKNIIQPAFIVIFLTVMTIHAFWNFFAFNESPLSYLIMIISGILFLLVFRVSHYEQIHNNHSIRRFSSIYTENHPQ